MIRLEESGVARGEGEASAPGAAFWGRKLRLKCHVTYMKCQRMLVITMAGLRKRGARLEGLLRGPIQWRVHKFLRRIIKS